MLGTMQKQGLAGKRSPANKACLSSPSWLTMAAMSRQPEDACEKIGPTVSTDQPAAGASTPDRPRAGDAPVRVRRTIYRYIDDLSLAGIPVYGKPGWAIG